MKLSQSGEEIEKAKRDRAAVGKLNATQFLFSRLLKQVQVLSSP